MLRMMYDTVLISSLFGLRMSKVYLSAIAVSATLFFSSSALSNQAGSVHDQLLDNRQCVILLHGLSRTSRSMQKMEQALLSAGYTTANIGKLHFLPHANRDHRQPQVAGLLDMVARKDTQAARIDR